MLAPIGFSYKKLPTPVLTDIFSAFAVIQLKVVH